MRVASSILLTVESFMAACALCACSSLDMGPMTMFVDPGKYDYHNCEQLTAARKAMTDRELELRLLMDKAERAPGGGFVNVIAYQTDHTSAREEVKVIDAAVRNKKCTAPSQSTTDVSSTR